MFRLFILTCNSAWIPFSSCLCVCVGLFWILLAIGFVIIAHRPNCRTPFRFAMTTEDGTRWWWLGPCVRYLFGLGRWSCHSPCFVTVPTINMSFASIRNLAVDSVDSSFVLCVYWNITSLSFSFDIWIGQLNTFSRPLFFFFFLPKATKPEAFRFCVFNWIATKIGKIDREIYRKGSWPCALDRRNPHTHTHTHSK